jgi:hypothetical protein
MISIFFDATLQCFTMDVIAVPDQHHVILQFQAGIVIPGPPQAPGEPPQQGLIPVGAIKIPTGFGLAKEFSDELVEALEKMGPPPKQSGLIVAQGPGAQQAADQLGEQAASTERALREGAPKED